jgi:protein TonB
MRVSSLKLAGSITAMLIAGCFMLACNNESENNSTNKDNTVSAPASDSSSSQATTATPAPKKKAGKASLSAMTDKTNEKMMKDANGYYNYTDVAPSFGKGQDALESYINNNIEYPQEAIDNNVEGTVSVQFAVDEQGKISNVKTVNKKIGYGLEEEAVKIVSDMPKWTPGQVKGKNVKTWRTLPIIYKLES